MTSIQKMNRHDWLRMALLLFIIGALVVIISLIRVWGNSQNTSEVLTSQESIVEIYTIGESVDETIDLLCKAEPVSTISITPQVSGKVTQVFVDEGDKVSRGQRIAQIENIQQRVAVADARVALESAELSLSELLKQNDPGFQESLVSQTQTQQEALIENARNTLFNTDLQAYPDDVDDADIAHAPQIIGNYNCLAEGEYIVELYSSAAGSGASYTYSGLESGTESVLTGGFGSRLGSCGLELVFPEEFKNNDTWIIPVPNTRSSEYFSVKKSFENAINNKDIVLNNTEVSPERVSQERGRVNQAQLRYQLALDNLSKTIITAGAAGVISGFDLDEGNYVSAFASLGEIKTIDTFELITSVNVEQQQYITPDTVATVGDIETIVSGVAATIDSVTQKIKVTITSPEGLNVKEGDSMACTLHINQETNIQTDGGVRIPLSAVSIIGITPHVFIVDVNTSLVESIPVSTGAILGEDIIIYGIDSGSVVTDARGLRSGQKVTITQ